MATKVKERRFVVAGTFSQGDQWLDSLLAIRPLRTEVIPTRVGDSEAIIAHVVEVHDDGEITDHGERPVFWSVVKGQLKAATPETPWVVGRLVKVGNTYRLDALTPGEEVLVHAALAQIDDH